jgi:hypothetical protein
MFQIRLLIILFIFSCSSYGQQKAPLHSSKKASIYSLVPGGGQFYNKKYWKIPIIYAGIGASLVAAKSNQDNYEIYLNAINNRSNPNHSDAYDNYSDSQLATIKNYYRKNRDLSYIIAAGIYIINIIDASVDAHLNGFNISDDLSLQIAPVINTGPIQNNTVLTLTLKL